MIYKTTTLTVELLPIIGGESETRTLNPFLSNGFQDRPTTIITTLRIVGRGGRI